MGTITVTVVNAPPVASAGVNTTPQGTAVSGQLTATDPDPSDLLTFGPASLTSAKGVTVTISSSGAYTYGSANSEGVDTFSFTVNDGFEGTASALITLTVTPTAGCDLYPITVHIDTVKNLAPGSSFDVYGGANPGNFGWLTWGGVPSTPTLVTSLTILGNSGTYVNPSDANDHQVSIGDWVRGSPGIKNSSNVSAKLDILKTIDVSVPVWDKVTLPGNNTLYQVVNFDRIHITDYSLPGTNKITATFLGFGCSQTPPPQRP